MVTSPTGKGVIVMGGETKLDEYSNAIFELSETLEWKELKQCLQNNLEAPLAIPIPDDLVYERKKSTTKQRFSSYKFHGHRRRCFCDWLQAPA